MSTSMPSWTARSLMISRDSSVTASTDELTIKNQRHGTIGLRMEDIRFDDGFGTDFSGYKSWLGSGNDLVAGGSGDETLIGYAGTDDLQGNGGADDIHGGAGLTDEAALVTAGNLIVE